MRGRADAHRIFFGFAALWAAISIPLWIWGSGSELSLAWHISEMGLGFVSALIAGYALSACSAWSGRAPLHGPVVLALAFLWITARLISFVQSPFDDSLPRLVNAAVFVAIAGLVWREWWHGLRKARRHAVPPFIIAICLLLAGAIVFTQISHISLILLPIWLVTMIGCRMMAAFLSAAAQRPGGHASSPVWPLAHLALITLGAAIFKWGNEFTLAMATLLLTTSALLTGFMLSLPLRHLRRDALLIMLALALACIPVGLTLLSMSYLDWTAAMSDQSGALHLLMIGGIGGTGIAVIARSNAIRMRDRLKARKSAVAGFTCVLLAAVLRSADLTLLASASWSLGWALVLIAHLRGCVGPVQRPVFSARLAANALPSRNKSNF